MTKDKDLLIKKLRFQIDSLQDTVRFQYSHLLKVTKGFDWKEPPKFLFENIN